MLQTNFSVKKSKKKGVTLHPISQTKQNIDGNSTLRTCIEFPKNRPFSLHILIIPNKIHLLPHITKEPIHMLLSKVIRPVKPIGSENPHLEMQDPAFLVRVQRVYIRRAVVPLEIVGECPQLGLDYVEVSAVGPVVP